MKKTCGKPLAALSLVLLQAVFSLCCAFSAYAQPMEDPFVGKPAYGVPVSEIKETGMDAGEKDKIISKIRTDLSYRGKIADKMLESGVAGTVVNLSGAPTYSEAREVVIRWITGNPEKAATYAIMLSGRSGESGSSPVQGVQGPGFGEGYGGKDYVVNGDGSIIRTVYKYSLSDTFLKRIKALTAAASDRSLSAENLADASRRLFEGTSPYQGTLKTDFDAVAGIEASAGGKRRKRGLSGSYRPAEYSGQYDNIKINRAALDNETSRAEQLLSAMRGNGKGPEGAEQYYAYAWKAYGNFAGYSSPLKSRKVITGKEADNLEQLRTDLRKALAGLSLKLMSLYTEELSRSLDDTAAGYDELRRAMRRLIEEIDEKLAEAGGLNDSVEITRILSEAQAAFSALYMAYSVYNTVFELGKQASGLGFSCLYDKMIFSLLSIMAPESPYIRVRNEAKGAVSRLSAVLKKAASGDIMEALEKGRVDNLRALLYEAEGYSMYNRKAQYYMWGMLFRPFEVEISVRKINNKGHAFFRPLFPWMNYHAEKMFRIAPASSVDNNITGEQVP
jgi:hypothetical protein